jgi:hypothetical protein
MVDSSSTVEEALTRLRVQADADFHEPPAEREAGRHTADIAELGLRVTLTRSLYPNRPDGVDAYAITISTIAVDRPPSVDLVQRVLTACFGAAAEGAQPRPGGERVRMFRLPASAVPG